MSAIECQCVINVIMQFMQLDSFSYIYCCNLKRNKRHFARNKAISKHKGMSETCKKAMSCLQHYFLIVAYFQHKALQIRLSMRNSLFERSTHVCSTPTQRSYSQEITYFHVSLIAYVVLMILFLANNLFLVNGLIDSALGKIYARNKPGIGYLQWD